MDDAAIMPRLMLSEFVIRFQHNWRATPLGERKGRRNSDNSAAHHHRAISSRYQFRLVRTRSRTNGLFAGLCCRGGKRAQETVATRISNGGGVPHMVVGCRKTSFFRYGRLSQPDLPRGAAFRVELVKVLLVF